MKIAMMALRSRSSFSSCEESDYIICKPSKTYQIFILQFKIVSSTTCRVLFLENRDLHPLLRNSPPIHIINSNYFQKT